MGSPFEMPPWIPPELLVRVRTSPLAASTWKASLCALPRSRGALKPLPMAKPLVAGMLASHARAWPRACQTLARRAREGNFDNT